MTGERFLVVDDDDLMLDTLKSCISLEGFEVHTASSGPMAVSLAREQLFDVIVSDVMMPGMSGIETIRAVKELHPGIISIVITGFASAETPIKAIKVGVDDYIYKPFDLDEFVHIIKRNLEAMRMKRLRDSLGREREAARRIQELLLPKSLPASGPITAAARYAYSMGMGGDYYDFIPLDEDRYAVLMGDVSGHDLSSAYLMGVVRTLIHLLVHQMTSPSQLLERINQQLHKDISQALYVTLFLGVVDLNRNELTWSNSGLPPSLLLRQGGELEELKLSSLPLGIFEEGQYEDRVTPFLPGDTLWLATDGVADTVCETGEAYGEDRLRAFIQAHHGHPVEKTAADLWAELEKFRNNTDLLDDYTYLGVQRAASSP